MHASHASEPSRNVTQMQVRGDCDIVITRTFNAPPRIVFDAWTRAEFVNRWWAPKSLNLAMHSCEADVRVGGKYRYVQRRDGEEFAFSGKYLEVTPHSRLVYTHVFEPMAHLGEVLVTITFEARGEKTLVTGVDHYPSKDALQGVLSSGMEVGMRDIMDQLDELVAQLH